MTTTVHPVQAARSKLLPQVLYVTGSSTIAAVATLPLGLLFFGVISPMFRHGGEGDGMSAMGMLWHCAQSCLLPSLLIALLIGLWGLHKRRQFGRQLNWPFWLIMAWGVSALAALAVGYSIEANPRSPFRLADMDFAPLNIRVALQAFLLFAWYSLLTLVVGAVHVTALERLFSRMGRE